MNFSDAELKALGLTRDSLPEALNPAGNSSPAAQTAQTPKPVKPSHAAFVEPSWFPKLRHFVATEHGACMFGPRGTGKSFAVRELSRQSNADLFTAQCFANMQVDTLIGCWTAQNGGTAFVEGPLTRAWRAGHDGLAYLAAEEANAAHTTVWSIANNLLDGTQDGLNLPTGETIPYSPGFRLILLYNDGYAGTREVNDALKDRIPPMYCAYPPKAIETQWIAQATGAPARTIERVIDLANMIRAASERLRFDLSCRPLIRWINMVHAGIATWQEGFDFCILDLAGDPTQAIAKRASLTEISKNCGMEKW